MIEEKIKIISAAKFSECGMYRYWLSRVWDQDGPKALCFGLNPSTANGVDNDPTINSLIRILTHNGYGGFFMMNLFAFISPNPEDLRTCPDPKKNNDLYMGPIAMLCQNTIFCWGAFPMAKWREKDMRMWFSDALCFGKNKDGSPKHPLYLQRTTSIVKY